MQVDPRLLGIGLYDVHHYRRKNFHFLFDSRFVTGYIIGMERDYSFRFRWGLSLTLFIILLSNWAFGLFLFSFIFFPSK